MTRASDLAKLLGAGATINDGTTITTADNTTQLTLTSTDADANAGPVVDLTRDSGSPADADLLGTLRFRADNSAGEVTNYAEIFARAEDVTDGTEDGKILVNTIVGGTERSRLEIDNTAVVINQDSIDSDFRVEGNNDTHALFVQAGSDHVGINNTSPNSQLTGADNLVIGSTGVATSGMTFVGSGGSGSQGLIHFSDATSGNARYDGFIGYEHTDRKMKFGTAQGERVQISASGEVTMSGQPCFSATADTTNIPLATITTVALSGERFDVGSNLDSNTFTAPITGKYLFTYMFYFASVDADHTSLDTHIKTSNKQYQQTFSPDHFLNSDSLFSVSGSVLADMDANDTCFFTTRVAGGAAQTDIHPDSQVSGVLIC